MLRYARMALGIAREKGMFLVLDADALFMVGQDISVVKGYRRAVVTPNIVEFKRLSEQVGIDPEAPLGERADLVSKALGGVTVLQKGAKDIISVNTTGENADFQASKLEAEEKTQETVEVDVEGGLKRCGGQGDVLSGCVGTMLAWGKCYEDGAFGYVLLQSALVESPQQILSDGKVPASRMPLLASIGGSLVTRTASRRAYYKEGRSVVTQDMLSEIGKSFGEVFGEDEQGQDKQKL
jgi:ATP-dependent NAD(P)H-hydrate dehydratase